MPAPNANAVPTDAELEELGRSLDTPDIPSKLRCGICDLLAINTLRLPCCSTNICETCYANEVTEECIICYHKPLDKSLCEPNKSMRITIKALLKKKYSDRLKRQVAAAKAAEVEQSTTRTENVESESVKDAATQEQSGRPYDYGTTETGQAIESFAIQAERTSVTLNNDSRDDHVAESFERDNPPPLTNLGSRKSSFHETEASAVQEDGQQKRVDVEKSLDAESLSGQGQWPIANGMSASSMNSNPNFNGMNGMSGMLPMDFTSMMAGGMMPMTGFPNMMGMGMMPMMSQMFGGLDGSNMGMNGMGMGFNGQNQFGGPWMNGQESYNNNSFGNGNFGVQSGFNTSSNPNNYNQMNDQAYANNDFQRGYGRQGFQNRRGRRGYYNGGFGRNQYNQSHQGNHQAYTNSEIRSQQYTPQSANVQPSEASAQTQNTAEMTKEDEETLMNSFAPGGEHDFDKELGRKPNDETSRSVAENADASNSTESKDNALTEVKFDEAKEDKPDGENQSEEISMSVTDQAAEVRDTAVVTGSDEKDNHESEVVSPQPIQTFISDEPRPSNMPPPGPSIPTGPAALQGRSFNRGGMTPSSSSQAASTPPIELKGLGVVGAPTGPRALREGKPNTGWSGLELSRGLKSSAVQPIEHKGRGRSRSRSPTRHQSPSRSRSRSHSPWKSQSGHYRGKRHRSRSESRESRRERREEKRRHRSHRHHDDQEADDRDVKRSSDRQYTNDEANEVHRSGHRSHRHYEEDFLGGEEANYSSSRSHRRHDRDSEVSKRRRHYEHARSKSPEDGRERDRELSDREKHRRREEVDDERRHRRKRVGSPKSPLDPSPTTQSAEVPDGADDYGSRKRRIRDRDAADEDHFERKRSRREYSPPVDKTSRRQSNSKPSTPATPTFPESASFSRRGSAIANGASRQDPAPSKPIPTGPRAAKQHQHLGRRDRVHEHNAPATPTKKNEKDMHTLDREARDRERLQKEMLRRAYMDPGQRRKPGAAPSRRMSYKYEDEGGSEARRVEREREAGRWA